jgi:hypothetical protein
MSSVGKWMKLEIIALSKISQTQKKNIVCFLSESRIQSLKIRHESKRGNYLEKKGTK